MHIAINISNGIPYATVMTSVREVKTVKKKSVVYLGRVLDEERGIYKSAERGVFPTTFAPTRLAMLRLISSRRFDARMLVRLTSLILAMPFCSILSLKNSAFCLR